MYHTFFILSSISGYLAEFHVFTIVNSAALNFGVHVSFWSMVFSGYLPRVEIDETYGNSIFSFLRNIHPILHSGCTNLHFHQ